jgi:hypothetical protein
VHAHASWIDERTHFESCSSIHLNPGKPMYVLLFPFSQYDLEEAKDRLRTEYALVLILEKFEPVGRMLIQQVFGW